MLQHKKPMTEDGFTNQDQASSDISPTQSEAAGYEDSSGGALSLGDSPKQRTQRLDRLEQAVFQLQNRFSETDVAAQLDDLSSEVRLIKHQVKQTNDAVNHYREQLHSTQNRVEELEEQLEKYSQERGVGDEREEMVTSEAEGIQRLNKILFAEYPEATAVAISFGLMMLALGISSPIIALAGVTLLIITTLHYAG